MESSIVPLIIHGEDVPPPSASATFVSNPGRINGAHSVVHGATPLVCKQAADSSAKAFETWKWSQPPERRRLFNRAAQLLRARQGEVSAILKQELSCSGKWETINVEDAIGILEEVAALATSGVLSGVIPNIRATEAHPIVLKEPLGVVLGIAPWNAPLILGFRAIAAAVAAGNTVILKGSELSPRTHFFIACLFRDAGFPPGVVNFIVHRPEDAAECFEALISHPGVRKCNFTGSTAVGRRIATRAAHYLKPVLLELGGKNYAVVLDDADVTQAVDEILEGGLMNTGQICMSTDLVLVSRNIETKFRAELRQKFQASVQREATNVINSASEARIRALVEDAKTKGASLTLDGQGPLAAALIEDVSPDMQAWTAESFGPVLALRVFDNASEAVNMVNQSVYGLSAAIFSKDQLGALHMAKRLNVGAVHVNASTVHDEVSLPHGGCKESGWGRFGSHWAFEEFLQTKTVILNP